MTAFVHYMTEYSWLTFVLLLVADFLLLCHLIYRAILGGPFREENLGDILEYTSLFFLTSWLVSYIIMNIARVALAAWLPFPSVIWEYTGYILVIVGPSIIYIYNLYAIYMRNPYLTANDFKENWSRSTRQEYILT